MIDASKKALCKSPKPLKYRCAIIPRIFLRRKIYTRAISRVWFAAWNDKWWPPAAWCMRR